MVPALIVFTFLFIAIGVVLFIANIPDNATNTVQSKNDTESYKAKEEFTEMNELIKKLVDKIIQNGLGRGSEDYTVYYVKNMPEGNKIEISRSCSRYGYGGPTYHININGKDVYGLGEIFDYRHLSYINKTLDKLVADLEKQERLCRIEKTKRDVKESLAAIGITEDN